MEVKAGVFRVIAQGQSSRTTGESDEGTRDCYDLPQMPYFFGISNSHDANPWSNAQPADALSYSEASIRSNFVQRA
jgi:hypothetical protein